ncbi:hypothetical protein BJX70DRAFT_362579 [Aspergillus crustosus]
MIATYRSYRYMDLISPRPLLMIAGADADTLYYTQEAISIAQEPKEMFMIPGLMHINLYDHANQSTPKLVQFFRENL